MEWKSFGLGDDKFSICPLPGRKRVALIREFPKGSIRAIAYFDTEENAKWFLEVLLKMVS